MSATDELRALLDERGVKWEKGASLTSMYTYWTDCNGHDVTAVGTDSVMFMSHFVTPAQAVEATLGRGTCKMDLLVTGEQVRHDCQEYIMHCNGCGHEFGHVLYNEDGDVWMSDPPRFCPNCGSAVRR